MSDVLSGLESMGLGSLSNIDLFNDKKGNASAEKKKEEKPEIKELEEKDLIYLKKAECPCCGREFTEKTIRPGKVRMISQDIDLRPRYKELDTMKYNVTACPTCGYAALTRDFTHLSSGQAKMVKEKISLNFTGLKYDGDTYSYDEAISRGKLALVSTVVKRGKISERAYICLTLGWLTRGKAESIAEDVPGREAMVSQLEEEENGYLLKAAEGFTEALLKESFPICGLDEYTFFYLLSALDYETGRYSESLRFIEKILINRAVSERIKDKARRIKEAISEIRSTEK